VIRVPVPLADRPYDVWVGEGAASLLANVLPAGVERIVLVTQPGVPDLVERDRVVARCELGEGEFDKTLATVEQLCRDFARAGLTRRDCVVAVGGGMVTDVAGFAAASYHRGIAVVHVPTTLLGMVDAAIGGKTGVNLPEGKNLVGAFWQPVAVLCDLTALETLPERERRSGLGEMAKYHFLTGDDLLALPLEERVARCVAIKAEVVVADEREATAGGKARGGAGRASLNYGHTLAHALEITSGHDLRHGEAVAIGLVYAAELAGVLDRIGQDRIDEHRAVIERYGLDASLPSGSEPDRLVELMGRDKKALDGLTFVLDGPQGVELVPGVDPTDVKAALARMGA
jgi:5-deoxy-5-amino-3-dehydroquinate synthase